MRNAICILTLALLATGCASGPTLGAMHAYCDESGYAAGTLGYNQCIYESSLEEEKRQKTLQQATRAPVWQADGYLGIVEEARCVTTLAADGSYSTLCTTQAPDERRAGFIKLRLNVEDLKPLNKS